jgi:hypothetical protein
MPARALSSVQNILDVVLAVLKWLLMGHLYGVWLQRSWVCRVPESDICAAALQQDVVREEGAACHLLCSSHHRGAHYCSA